ncbi:phytase [Penicillium angulare]|uniref:phytase n=1 Tax=Penicillium angulare TaxID=116970 RepID=UPI00254158C6|nr:phytase [Penicillium angulare]KAJ5280813.1 phytase [Penicillium angulare]
MAGYKNNPIHSIPEEECLLGERPDAPLLKSISPKAKAFRIVALLTALISAIALALTLKNGYESSSMLESVPASVSRNGKPDQPPVASYRSRKQVTHPPRPCNSIQDGYQCFADLSHSWGQYSPYFSLADNDLSSTSRSSSISSISDAVPQQCNITFVQVLSRHGARYPTASKSEKYAQLIQDIQANATAYKGKASFLKTYNYTLGSDDLTTFGEIQMVNSGIKFYSRYESLSRNNIPFIRASGSSRVVESGQFFIEGFQKSKKHDKNALSQSSPKINVVISEDTGSNNTLNHNTCPAFEKSSLGDKVEDNYTAIFVPAIQSRLQSLLPGTSLSLDDVTYLMDLCAFNTVSDTPDGSTKSAFCALFTALEWKEYSYYQSLSKYYGYGAGNPLGPTQGVGFVNELIARMTHTPVRDHTTTNRTLDSKRSTFPLDKAIYADFTHDNGLISIYFALGLYNGTAPLPKNHVQSFERADGYSASWTVPFGARAYFEMMDCGGEQPLVRILVNDRVVPLSGCDVDEVGRCKRDDFVRALSFAREGGRWEDCYV